MKPTYEEGAVVTVHITAAEVPESEIARVLGEMVQLVLAAIERGEFTGSVSYAVRDKEAPSSHPQQRAIEG